MLYECRSHMWIKFLSLCIIFWFVYRLRDYIVSISFHVFTMYGRKSYVLAYRVFFICTFLFVNQVLCLWCLYVYRVFINSLCISWLCVNAYIARSSFLCVHFWGAWTMSVYLVRLCFVWICIEFNMVCVLAVSLCHLSVRLSSACVLRVWLFWFDHVCDSTVLFV